MSLEQCVLILEMNHTHALSLIGPTYASEPSATATTQQAQLKVYN